jgi:hypothetical protein
MLMDEPKRTIPKTLQDEPKRQKDRRLIDEPRRTKSSTERLEPNLVIP